MLLLLATSFLWGQVSTNEQVTWVGIVSGGLPVAAGAVIVVAVLWKRLNEALARIELLQKERIEEVRDLAPLVKEMGTVLVRATVTLERLVTSEQGGR